MPEGIEVVEPVVPEEPLWEVPDAVALWDAPEEVPDGEDDMVATEAPASLQYCEKYLVAASRLPPQLLLMYETTWLEPQTVLKSEGSS